MAENLTPLQVEENYVPTIRLVDILKHNPLTSFHRIFGGSPRFTVKGVASGYMVYDEDECHWYCENGSEVIWVTELTYLPLTSYKSENVRMGGEQEAEAFAHKLNLALKI